MRANVASKTPDIENDQTSENQFGSLPGRRMIRAIAIAGAVSVVVLLSGCASAPASGGADAIDNYNSDTDYSQLRYANHL
jgi:hypothetical protein